MDDFAQLNLRQRSTTSTPLLSIVIPTRNRSDSLMQCLAKLHPSVQKVSAASYEVIVSDDGTCSTSSEAAVKRNYPWAKWISGPRRGPAANRNNGADSANGQWLVFTDDDCLPDPQWLSAYANAIVSNPNVKVFEGRTYANRDRISLAETAPLNDTGGFLWSCNFAIERRTFFDLKGFNNQFPFAAMEDVELRLRLNKASYRQLFVRDASVVHPWRLFHGWKEPWQQYKSTMVYLSIHPDERATINAKMYLKYALYGFGDAVFTAIVKYNGRGVVTELLKRMALFCMAIRLTFCYAWKTD